MRRRCQSSSHNGILVERNFRFLPTKKFIDTYKVEPQMVGQVPETFKDELGNRVEGILILDDTEDFLRIKTYHRLEGVLSNILQPESSQLRPGQAEDFRDQEWLREANFLAKQLLGRIPLT